MEYPYEIEMKVRDYECDIQGIVNNSVYQNYLEHARHEYLRSNGVSFTEMHNRGMDAVVARIEMAFKTPLRPGDDFTVKINVQKEGIKYVFHQVIYRKADMKLSLKARVDAVVTVNGKLVSAVPEFDKLVMNP
ncbi:MAG: acyl-CoA thioesterase [Paludibacter sp.]|nr:acyl-CoA thioesterase [Paludibacter sp.]